MRTRPSPMSSVMAGVALTLGLAAWSAGAAAPSGVRVLADTRPNAVPVDTELVLAAGITINGLPIMLGRPGGGYGRYRVYQNLDIYYEDCVIGGPGSFVVGIKDRSQFKEATRTKLVLEVAGRTPKPQVIPAQARTPRVYCS